MTGAGWIEKCDGDFNSHPHEEDDNVVSRNTSPTRHFNSHPHEEDDQETYGTMLYQEHFNSHPHEEDDRDSKDGTILKLYFNSHPHEEDDAVCLPFPSTPCSISTHILTKRMTCKKRNKLLRLDISTHILTKRMTFVQSQKIHSNIISTHILTKRMTAILNKNNLFKIAYYINNKHFISIVDIFFHFHIYF